MDVDCISYSPDALEFFVPYLNVFANFCESTDKTRLFIMSLTRLMIYVIIYYVISDIINYEYFPIIQYILIITICINILYIGIVVSKQSVK